jgi:hypothetical protein
MKVWRVDNHFICDAGQLADKRWNWPPGVDERGPLIFNSPTVKTDCPDFDDRIFLRVQTSRFDIQGYQGRHARIIPSGLKGRPEFILTEGLNL